MGIAYYIGSVFYSIFLHPLRSFPGPLLLKFSGLTRIYHHVHGDIPFKVARWHAQYGPIVRIGPNELAFSDPQAWKDIYGHRHGGEEEMPKYDGFYRLLDNIPRSIINAGRDEHAALRRALANGFSERSLRGQEPIMGQYVDLLVRRLREYGKGGAVALNMREWLNWTTFDIIGDLGFGSPFGGLENSDYHPWVRIITDTIRQNTMIGALAALGLRTPMKWVMKSGVMPINQHRALVREKLLQRMELGAERPDLIEGLIRKKDEWNYDLPKLAINASTLIIAGSETTATLLSGATFLLTMNPDKLRLLQEEVRSAFSNDEEITLTSVGNLTYMLACLNETLRHYPPVAGALPRQAPKGGATITGKFVPEGTVVAVWQWAINHDPHFWTEPETFAPERFLGNPEFKHDQLDAMQPFSVGPRNCIGRNLAYAEMRLILAKIIYNFDMKIDDGSRRWLADQKAFVIWDKPPLNVYMTPVER